MLIFNGTKALVSISGALSVGLPQLASSQTNTNYYSASFALSGGLDLVATPGSGKKLYIYGIHSNAVAAAWTVYDGDTTPILFTAAGAARETYFAIPLIVSTSLKLGGTGGQNLGNLTINYFEA